MPNLIKFLPVLSLLGLLLAWYGLAVHLDNRLLPSPSAVMSVLWEHYQSGKLVYHLSATLFRLTASFVLAMVIGCVFGIAMGRNKIIDALFDHWLIIFLNIPALVTIILCYVWFGLTETAAIVAIIINKVPNVAVTIREGARALDQGLLAMAKCYRFSMLKTLRHVILPQMTPYFMAATRSGLALIWKLILLVELQGRSNGVGYQLHIFFQLSDVAGILAYTVAFVAIIQMIELLVLKPLENHALRWRRTL